MKILRESLQEILAISKSWLKPDALDWESYLRMKMTKIAQHSTAAIQELGAATWVSFKEKKPDTGQLIFVWCEPSQIHLGNWYTDEGFQPTSERKIYKLKDFKPAPATKSPTYWMDVPTMHYPNEEKEQ